MDLTKKRYRNFAELQDYCYCVASTVGLMMTKVFGATNEEAALQRAIDMGTAMQLTNILRDVGEDYQRGRVYLPADEMDRFGVRNDDFVLRVPTPGFVDLMKFQIERAHSFYSRASAGITLLTNDGSRFCVKLMSRTYAQILPDIVAHGYDSLSRRAYVPLHRKARIALKALLEKEPQTMSVYGSEHSVSLIPTEQPRESTHAT